MSVMQVRVPATTANLGPGFDSFGCALSLANTVTFEPSEKQLEWVGYKPEYATEDNLIYQAFRATFAYLGEPVAGVRISAREEIPFSRGLGSSAAMLVAGALGANAMSGNQLSLCQLLEITNRIEGHPDNLAPAFYGGLTASLVDDSGMPITRNYQLHESWEFLVFIPDFPLATAEARAVLPRKVELADAVYNVSHAALLLRALADGDADLLRVALADRLHQPYRETLIPGFAEISEQITAFGGKICISGAGPTLLCITQDIAPEQIRLPQGWKVLRLVPDLVGAVVSKI